MPDDSKQDDTNIAAHSKQIIELIQNRKISFSELSTMWENTDGCAEQYICDTALYLLSMLAQTYNIIIYRVFDNQDMAEILFMVLMLQKKYFFQFL